MTVLWDDAPERRDAEGADPTPWVWIAGEWHDAADVPDEDRL